VLCQEHRYRIPGKRETYSQYNEAWQDALGRAEGAIGNLPSAQPEPLTDKEQRIFLAAMERERKVCKEVDDQYVHEPYEVLLTKVCDEIKRKVKRVLWT
jgi:predicted protein tyrosine phosphatase